MSQRGIRFATKDIFLYGPFVLCICFLVALSVSEELYSAFVSGLTTILPAYIFSGDNNIAEVNGSMNLVLTSFMFLLLGLLWLVSLRSIPRSLLDEAKVTIDGRSEILRRIQFVSRLVFFGISAVTIIGVFSVLEVQHGEGPHVQLFCWPFVIAILTNAIRPAVVPPVAPVRDAVRRGMLFLLPGAFLIFPHWMTLVFQFVVGIALVPDVMRGVRLAWSEDGIFSGLKGQDASAAFGPPIPTPPIPTTLD